MTARPWQVREHPTSARWEIVGPRGYHDHVGDALSIDDAHLIVRAANLHDELVAALRCAIECIGDFDPAHLATARKVLAKANKQ
jgi:hypothetical protein